MNVRYKLIFFPLVACLLFAAASADAQEKFKLKPGAKGRVCLNCHVTFQEKLKSPSVHTPVKNGECSGCHNPHTSSHGKLLYAEPSEICSRCHTVIPGKSLSVHKIVAEGNCTLCHDPHASRYKYNLTKAGNELCLGCHKEIADRIAKIKFKHVPVEKGCLNCHNPHASAASDSLLKEAMPSLCIKCHKTGSPVFAQRHMNYPVAKSACTSCHSPHGSSKGGILYDNVHKPVVGKMCSQCHEEPTSQTPFKTKKEGYELCRGCHSNMMNEAFSKNRLHWPLVTKQGCLSCHTPHASAETALLKGPAMRVCGSCHEDTIARQDRAQKKHAPVKEGNCTVCHAPHSSDSTFLLKGKSVIDACGACHDWQKHTAHPMGDKSIDPRNKNIRVQCLSCHSAHGTDFKNMLLFGTVSEMCTQCHVEYKR